MPGVIRIPRHDVLLHGAPYLSEPVRQARRACHGGTDMVGAVKAQNVQVSVLPLILRA